MRRLLKAPDGGLPYVNSDLTDILQAQHIRSYRAMLDGINYGSTSSAEPLNSGIILSGCEIISTNGSNFVMSFSNSVVYIDGEFYQNDPTYQTANQTISGPFYLIPGPTASETRVLRDLTTSATVSNTQYFTYSTLTPTVPYIKFSSQGTSRYLKRIIKYFTSRTGDIYVTKSKINFDNNGDGFNDMEGFVILDSISGVSGSPDLSGKFLVGGNNSLTTGGSHSSIISQQQLPSHTHTTSRASFLDFRHDHLMNRGLGGIGVSLTNSTQGNPDLPNTDINMGSVFGAANAFSSNDLSDRYGNNIIKYTGGVKDYPSSDLAMHTHSIPTDFGNGVSPVLEHENRPPYYVVVYYTKKQN